jgi:tetratricopeptide (TPR) repeat protein
MSQAAHDPKGSRFDLAVALHKDGQFESARALYRQHLIEQPAHFDSLHLLGLIESELGYHDAALELISRSITANPRFAAAHLNLGLVFKKMNRFKDALESFDRALSLKPDYAVALNNKGVVHYELNQFEAALASYTSALEINSKYADAFNNKGVVLQDLRRHSEALLNFEKAIDLRPELAEPWKNRGYTLIQLNRYEEALSSCARALEIDPNYADAHNSKGVALMELGRIDEAIKSFKRALSINSADPRAQMNIGIAYLLLGRFDVGWEAYEWRWKTKRFLPQTRAFTSPQWTGVEDLKGKTILLHGEQGLGDRIQFCRYAEKLKKFGARTVLEAPKPLMDVFEGLRGVDVLIAEGDVLPEFDFHCPLLSLPKAFGTELHNIPRPKRYLTSKSDLRKKWVKKRLRSRPLAVGLAWSGNPSNGNDHSRTIPLHHLVQFLPKEIDYFCLQKDIRESDRKALEQSPISYYGDELNFAETAALIDSLDLVITVDTSIAHLSGALGKATWIMLPFVPDWRWMLNLDTSPWYPDAKLYRQGPSRDWRAVFERIAMDLKTYHRIFDNDSTPGAKNHSVE